MQLADVALGGRRLSRSNRRKQTYELAMPHAPVPLNLSPRPDDVGMRRAGNPDRSEPE